MGLFDKLRKRTVQKAPPPRPAAPPKEEEKILSREELETIMRTSEDPDEAVAAFRAYDMRDRAELLEFAKTAKNLTVRRQALLRVKDFTYREALDFAQQEHLLDLAASQLSPQVDPWALYWETGKPVVIQLNHERAFKGISGAMPFKNRIKIVGDKKISKQLRCRAALFCTKSSNLTDAEIYDLAAAFRSCAFEHAERLEDRGTLELKNEALVAIMHKIADIKDQRLLIDLQEYGYECIDRVTDPAVLAEYLCVSTQPHKANKLMRKLDPAYYEKVLSQTKLDSVKDYIRYQIRENRGGA